MFLQVLKMYLYIYYYVFYYIGIRSNMDICCLQIPELLTMQREAGLRWKATLLQHIGLLVGVAIIFVLLVFEGQIVESTSDQ